MDSQGTAVTVEVIEADMAGVGTAVTARATAEDTEAGMADMGAGTAVTAGVVWGWGGLGLGLYVATLPLYYDTLWADGVPYYYADGNYFQWDGDVGQYETVDPPADVQQQAAALSPNLIAYPKNGQTEAQQATDKSACRTWATAQSGFDPTQGTAATESTTKRADYMRAQAACLEGRGYSVE